METVQNLLSRNENSVSLSELTPIGCFSLNLEREFVNDISSLKYFIYPSEENIDLNAGFDTFIKKPESAKNEKIDNLLKFVLHNYQVVRSSHHNIVDVDFLCFRGLLSTIMKTPYEAKTEWSLCATKWKGIIYLCEFDKVEAVFADADRFNYWGHKFEHCTLSSLPDKRTNNGSTVNECEEFCVLFKSKLNDLKLCYGAEIDGIISDELHVNKEFLKNANFIELKTSKLIENKHQDYSFHKYKLLKFWSQSFLVGIKRIIVGYRDDRGILRKVTPLHVADIPSKCSTFWDFQLCLKFLYEFLFLVKKVMNSVDDYKITWKFQYDCKAKTVNYYRTTASDYNFLPEWYINEINKLEHAF